MKAASRIVSAILLITIAFVTLCPIDFRPGSGHPDFERAAAYLILGATLSVGFPQRLRSCLAVVVGVAIGLEVLQLIDPGRHARFDDMLVKATAGAVGALLTWFLAEGYRRFRWGRVES
jgi:hypothetical protein